MTMESRQSKRLKVYGGNTFLPESGQTRIVVAASSWAEVSRITGLTLYYLQGYWSITSNDSEVSSALAAPGEIIVKAPR